MLEVNAPVVDHPGSRKALVDRALARAADEALARRGMCAHADLIVTPSAAIVPPDVPRSRILELEWGADTDGSVRAPRRATPWTRQPGDRLLSSPAPFARGTARSSWSRRSGCCTRRARPRIARVLIGDGPERPAAERAAGGIDGRRLHGTRCRTSGCQRRWPPPTSAWRRSTSAQHQPLTLGFYWSPLKIFEYMASGLPVVAPAIPRLHSLVAQGTEGVLYEPATPEALADALATLDDEAAPRVVGAAARERGRARVQLAGALPRARAPRIERLIA